MAWEKSETSPRRWSDMAIDFKLMFALHGAVMIQFIMGGYLSTADQAAIQGTLISLAIILAVLHRRQAGWRWRRAGLKQYLAAALALVLVVLFLGAAVPMAPPTSPHMFPWYMGGAQIGLFNALAALRIARASEVEFQADCDPDQHLEESVAESSPEPDWRLWVRRIYSAVFIAIWLEFLGFFYYHGTTFRGGVATPNAIMNTAMSEHGHTVYVTATDFARDQTLMMVGMVGIFGVVISGVILHFIFRVPVFGNDYISKNAENE